MGAEPLRVVIVDNHEVYRAGLRAQLTASVEVEVVGEAATADEAVAATARLRPSLILMDLRTPKSQAQNVTYDGVVAIKEIRRSYPEVVVIALMMYADDDLVAAALTAGANGFLVKERDDSDLVAKLLVAMDGTMVISSSVAARLRDMLNPTQSTSYPFPQLTPQQRKILEYVVAGLDNNAIALRMSLSPKTIRAYISTIFHKLEVHNRSDLITKVREADVAPARRYSRELPGGVPQVRGTARVEHVPQLAEPATDDRPPDLTRVSGARSRLLDVHVRSDPAEATPGQPVRVWIEVRSEDGSEPLAEPVRSRVILDAVPALVTPVSRIMVFAPDRSAGPVEFEVTPPDARLLPLVFRVYRDSDSHLLLEVTAELPVRAAGVPS